MFRITPLFGLVLIIHVVVLGLLVIQPGCQTGKRDAPEPEATPTGPERVPDEPMTTTVRPSPREAMTAPTSIDDAFNAGFTSAESRPAVSSFPVPEGRDTPQRPGRMLSDSTPIRDPLPATGDTRVPVVDDEPRFASYTVAPGDSLWKIAQRHELDLPTLLEANGLSRNSVIQPGQVLQIPLEAPELAPLPSGDRVLAASDTEMESSRYTVQRGDTLTSIARAFDTTVAEIKALNDKRADTIRVGENLIIPGSGMRREPPAPRQEPQTESRRPVDTGITHVVQAGENPSMIAARYGMTTRDLIRLNNNLDPRRLQVGQVLKIEPAPGKEPSQTAAGPVRAPEPRAPEPVRIQVPPRTAEPEPEPEFDPADLFEDLEEIPVQRIENSQ